MSDIFVYIEHNNGRTEDVSFEILGKAKELAAKLNAAVCGIIIGDSVGNLADDVSRRGADKVYVAEDRLLEKYSTELYTKVVEDIVNARKPSMLLIGATYNGRDLAGRLAVRLHAGLTANAVSLEIEDGTNLLLAAVPSYGGSIHAVCKSERGLQMSTVRAGVFKPFPSGGKGAGEIITIVPNVSAKPRVRVIESSVGKKADVGKAEIVVVAGLGAMGNLVAVEELRKELGAELGVTRPLADKGLATRDRQVGSTGVSVKSKLTVVLGASGASHFVSGIDSSGTVISINTDPKAPISSHADYNVIEDCNKLLPLVIKGLRPGK